ncbi:hypothetical protein ACWFRJ_40330 [Streptomyces sp. NPDC055239]
MNSQVSEGQLPSGIRAMHRAEIRPLSPTRCVVVVGRPLLDLGEAGPESRIPATVRELSPSSAAVQDGRSAGGRPGFDVTACREEARFSSPSRRWR